MTDSDTPTISIREATADDCLTLFSWRNDKTTRKMALNTGLISFSQHLFWFEATLLSPEKLVLIAESNGIPVGVCRFDYVNVENKATVSINLNPKYRGKRFSKIILKKAVKIAMQRFQCPFVAVVRKENKVSQKLFLAVGFELVSQDSQLINYTLPFNESSLN